MGKEIGMRIAKLRIDKDLTQAELGKELGVSRDVIAKWEGGTRELCATNIDMIGKYFNVSCDYLIRGVSEKNKTVADELGLTEKAVNELRRCVQCNAHEVLQLFNEMVSESTDFTRLAIIIDKSVQCDITLINDDDSEEYDWDSLPEDWDYLPHDMQYLEELRCPKKRIALTRDMYEYLAHKVVIEIVDEIIGNRVHPTLRRKVQNEMEAQYHAP